MPDCEDSGDVRRGFRHACGLYPYRKKKSQEEEQYDQKKLRKDFNAWLKDHYEKVLNGED